MLERKVDVVETDQGTAPKWGSSGTVTLPAFVAERLAEHLAAFPPGPDGLVFTAPRGGPLHYADFYRRRWCKAQETLGWGTWVGKRFTPEYRNHDLRHTAVALAIAAGAHPKEIQELCRHRSITTTLNEYGHHDGTETGRALWPTSPRPANPLPDQQVGLGGPGGVRTRATRVKSPLLFH
jgi:integrase